MAGTPLNLPASLPLVPGNMESKDGSFNVLDGRALGAFHSFRT